MSREDLVEGGQGRTSAEASFAGIVAAWAMIVGGLILLVLVVMYIINNN